MSLQDILHSPASHGSWFLLAITVVLLVYLIVETIWHRRNLQRIPIRIHVNGTRGKSSITRLIAGGLRKSGMITCAKTTGTIPRFIDPTGKEHPIYRPSHSNILEQIKIIREASTYKPQAIVIECMALQPLLQSVCELKLIRSTHGVISNTRADHLDVMGPEEIDVARALAGTTPIEGHLYTAEKHYFEVLKTAALDRKTTLTQITEADIATVDDNEMEKFCYTEHKENVALALRLCMDLGIPRETALQGMWEATPDPGALTTHEVYWKQHHLIFVNAFAANDPESTSQLWHQIIHKYSHCKRRIALINCRNDRRQRSQQLAEACAKWEPADQYIVIGTGTSSFIQTAESHGISKMALLDASMWDAPTLFQNLVETERLSPTLIVGMGNIAGIGFQIVDYFRHRAKIS